MLRAPGRLQFTTGAGRKVWFTLRGKYRKKSSAKQDAQRRRDHDQWARVIKIGQYWCVYSRLP